MLLSAITGCLSLHMFLQIHLEYDERTTKPRGGRDQNIYAILERCGACFMSVELAGLISKYMELFAASLEVRNDLTCEDSATEPESRTSNFSQIIVCFSFKQGS